MGIWPSKELVEGEVDGYCDERYKDVKTLFASQKLAQLCVYVDKEIVVSVFSVILKCFEFFH